MGSEDWIMGANKARARAFILGCAFSPLVVIAAGCGTTSAAKPDLPTARAQKPEQAQVQPTSAVSTSPEAKDTIQKATFEADKLQTSPADKPSTVKIVARINDRVVLDEEVRDAVIPSIMSMSPEERSQAYHIIYNRELQRIIDRELVLMDLTSHFGKTKPQYLSKLKEAAGRDFQKYYRTIKSSLEKKNGTKAMSDEEVKKILRESGFSLDGYRRHHERNFMSMEYMRAIIYPMVRDVVNRQQIVDYYNEHLTEFETVDRVHWQDIFLDASKFRSKAEAGSYAGQILERARRGEDFTKLVKEYDQGDAAWRGGEGVWSRPGEVQPPELEPMLFRMKANEVSNAIEVGNGFHLVRVAEREHAGKKPLDDKLQLEIRHKLQSQIAEREMRRVISELRRKAAIEILDEETAKSE